MIRSYGIESMDESEEQACMHMYQCVILLRENKVKMKVCEKETEREYLSPWKVESGQNIARRYKFTEVIDQRGRKGECGSSTMEGIKSRKTQTDRVTKRLTHYGGTSTRGYICHRPAREFRTQPRTLGTFPDRESQTRFGQSYA